MKLFRIILPAILIMAISASCTNLGNRSLATETAEYTDTTAHSIFRLAVELPAGSSRITKAIRSELISVIKDQLEKNGYEEECTFRVPECDSDDINDIVECYGKAAAEHVRRLADADYAESAGDIEDDVDMEFEAPGWDTDIALTMLSQNKDYAVFLSQNYVYLGGAHGGITGAGPLTFRMKDGALITNFIRSGGSAEFQSILIDGLISYFAENGEKVHSYELKDMLLLEDSFIPLPAYTPYPTEDGLVFTYQQYEITAYAYGMPTFTVSYYELEPYLTYEAKDLLGL